MTQFTSFVAVEERVINIGGKQRRVHVPVEMPDGVNPAPTSPQYATFAAASPSLMRAGNPGGFGGGGGAQSGGIGGFSSKQADHKERTQDQALRPKPAEKIENSLRTAKGSVEVMVWLHDLQPATLTKLKELGFKVAESDKGLVLLIGSCPASVLEKIASLEQVRRIEPLK
jgi:Ca-activated chloride channel family protein